MANFTSGNNASLGRKPGSRNRLQGAFVSALAKDFEEHGEGVIRIARIEKPVEYLRLIAVDHAEGVHRFRIRTRHHGR